MKIKISSFALLLSSFIYSQGIDTQQRNDAGAYGEGVKSGFFQTSSPLNFPVGATQWWHLLDVRHDNTSNNYAMQFSGSFFDQDLYFRKTNNSPTTGWSKILKEDPSGNTDITNDLKIGNNIITGGNNSWIFHSPESSNALFIAPFVNGDWNWGKQFLFTNNGDAAFQGKFEAKEIKVTQTPTADFVFEESYGLPELGDVEKFIKENKHLPEIASAKEMKKDGVNIGDFQIKLLQKIEELTLYSIEQNKQLKLQNDKLNIQTEKIEMLEKKLSTKNHN